MNDTATQTEPAELSELSTRELNRLASTEIAKLQAWHRTVESWYNPRAIRRMQPAQIVEGRDKAHSEHSRCLARCQAILTELETR